VLSNQIDHRQQLEEDREQQVRRTKIDRTCNKTNNSYLGQVLDLNQIDHQQQLKEGDKNRKLEE